MDQVLTSLGVLLGQARTDLAEDYASESHQRLVGSALRELALDSLWLGAAPSGPIGTCSTRRLSAISMR
jgi:hypothetical protein